MLSLDPRASRITMGSVMRYLRINERGMRNGRKPGPSVGNAGASTLLGFYKSIWKNKSGKLRGLSSCIVHHPKCLWLNDFILNFGLGDRSAIVNVASHRNYWFVVY